MIDGGKILTKDRYGDKVIQLKDGNIAKFFRLKRLISSALIWPYAKRFVRGIDILKGKNIPTVRILNTYKVPSIKRDLVVYAPITGPSLRELIKTKSNPSTLLLDFASFFAHLHNQGIYFRSIHFNNVIVPHARAFGLIDVTDLQYFSSSPLSMKKRARNFRHILHYPEDRQALSTVTLDRFLDAYVENVKFKSEKETEKFIKSVLQLCEKKLNE